MDRLLRSIQQAWGWTGLDPVEVVGENDFGNLMIKAADGRYWRLIPEDLTCTVIAESRTGLDRLSHDQRFLRDWYMSALTEAARERLGDLEPGRKYCFVIPGPLGGKYEIANIKTLSLDEMIRLSGDLARQLKDLPEGAEIELRSSTNAV